MLLLDVLSSLPFHELEPGTDNSNNLLRYLHLLRLTRLARRSKIGKTVRLFLNMTHKCAEMLRVYSGLSRLVTALCTVLILVHLGACMWFYSARLGDFQPDTWVFRRDLQDEQTSFLYLTSFYWAITTLTTVGYGDISARTELEMLIAMCWMMFGVGFYSFVVGSFTSALTSLDSKSLLTQERLQIVHLFAKDTGLREELVKKLETEVKDSVQTVTLDEVQRKSLLSQLSKALRLKVARRMFDDAAEKIVFFTEIDSACLAFIVPLLTLRVVQAGKFLYEKGDYADEVYFVLQGRLLCVYGRRNTAFKTIVQGAYCGEIELISNSPRNFSLMTEQNSELLIMTKDLFQAMMSAFPLVAAKVQATASERQIKNQECLKEVLDVLEAVEIRHLGTLDDLAGHARLDMKETEERPREKAVEAVLMAKSEEEVAAEIKKQMATLRAELTRIEKASQSFLQAQLS
jgi:hyperpolarization activated cyclic nucleotide-gated potassium channel 1